MSTHKNKIIVALDVNSFDKAKRLVDKLAPYVGIFKVGSELFTSSGPRIIKYIHGKKKKVFLDLKFHDIPNTVASSAAAVTRLGVFMFNVHAEGGEEMMIRTAKAVKNEAKNSKARPKILAVTVLTSKNKKGVTKKVLRLALEAKKAGLDGIVCSGKETKSVKKACGKKFLVVNPGIRPAFAVGEFRSSRTSAGKPARLEKDDQKRVTAPLEAVKNGADFIVVGRPIIEAKNPALAANTIMRELS